MFGYTADAKIFKGSRGVNFMLQILDNFLILHLKKFSEWTLMYTEYVKDI